MFANLSVSYLGMLVAAVVSMVIGAIWYAPAVFGNLWMKLSGMTAAQLEEMKKKGMGKSYVLGFVLCLVTAFVLENFLSALKINSVSGALQFGFWVWLGFIAPVMSGAVLWEARSWNWFLLGGGHYLLALLVQSVILAKM